MLDFGLALVMRLAPVAFGLYMVVFNPQFSLIALRHRKAMWRMDFTETDVRIARVYAFVIGVVLVISGLIALGE